MSECPSLGDAAGFYLASLAAEKRGDSQKEIYKFLRWFGREREFDGINPAEVDDYSENAARSDPGHVARLSLVRAFLSYSKKKGWSTTNLGTHLKAKKIKTRSSSITRNEQREAISMTREGHTKLTDELEVLKEERLVVIVEMTKAAADKDFRENAPLHAAREKRGMIEGRILEIEATLHASVIVDEGNKDSQFVDIGRKFVLCNTEKGIEVCYTLVGPREADPANSRISTVSPIGKAVIGKKRGETVEINAPAGIITYQLKDILGK